MTDSNKPTRAELERRVEDLEGRLALATAQAEEAKRQGVRIIWVLVRKMGGVARIEVEEYSEASRDDATVGTRADDMGGMVLTAGFKKVREER